MKRRGRLEVFLIELELRTLQRGSSASETLEGFHRLSLAAKHKVQALLNATVVFLCGEPEGNHLPLNLIFTSNNLRTKDVFII